MYSTGPYLVSGRYYFKILGVNRHQFSMAFFQCIELKQFATCVRFSFILHCITNGTPVRGLRPHNVDAM